MRKITYWLSLVMIFIIPWEDSLSITVIGSLAKLVGLLTAGCWLFTILTEGQLRKPHIFHAFVLLFFLWNAASYFWTLDGDRTIRYLTTYAQIFLLLLIIWDIYRKPSNLIAGLQAYVLGSFVDIASAISNFLTGKVIGQYELRYSATGVNAVDLSLLLLLGIPIAWHLYNQADKKKNSLLKFINLAYIPLSIFCVLLTGSRTSLFAAIPAVIFIFWPNKLDIARYIFISVVLAVSLVIIQSLLPAGIIERLSTVISSISVGDIGGRMALWGGAISVFLAHPLLGSGSGTLNTLIGSVAHQTFLSILAETGLIGFLLFACILAIVVNQAARLLKGYSGLWFSVFFVWVVGVLALSWELKKFTWVIFSFMILEGVNLQEHYRLEKLKSTVSETEKG